MVLINYATKEIVAKIVYYGPGLCGKTTNLQQVYARLNPKKRGKMISLATEADRTLFFDFLPMELGMVQGFKVRFQLYTVPGQVYYAATRRLVLKGADAVVFVADSQSDVMPRNAESVIDMKQNLMENGLDPDVIPIVFQYNKRDLGNILDIEMLNRELNYRSAPHFAASAVDGAGVMETFKEMTRLLLNYLKGRHAIMDTDKLRELPAEVFEMARPVEEKPVEYELELGSAIREEGAGDDVVAGELLDQIEVISLADTVQAEAFFDDVRKGASTEEARQKAEMVSVQPGEGRPSDRLVDMVDDFLADAPPDAAPPQTPPPEPEAELAAPEIVPAVKDEPPAPPRPPEPPRAAARETLETIEHAQPESPPVWFTESRAALAESPAPAAVPPPDMSLTIVALDRLEQKMAVLAEEVAGLKAAVSALAAAPPASAPASPPAPAGLVKGVEEMSKVMKSAMEGQDRLLLSILESVRETRKGLADTQERIEDALKYIIDRLRDGAKDAGGGARKKWF